VSQDELRKLASEAKSAVDDFYNYFDPNRIYLDEKLCKEIDDYHSHVLFPIAHVEATALLTDATAVEMSKAKENSLRDLMTKAHPIRDQLAKEFRLILGVIEKP